MKKIGSAIVGCGSIAEWKYLENLSKIEGVENISFQGGRAQELAAKYGAPGARVCQTLNEVLSDERVDVVHVCTPNNAHASITIAALDAGKHVMCEKPMAITVKEAEAMAAAARRNHRLLSIGYQARFGENAKRLKAMCAAGELGDIYFARAYAVRRRGVPTWGHFLDREIQGGGCLIDLGTHAIDLALWLLDNYEPLYVVGSVFHKLNGQHSEANRWGPWDTEKFQVEDSAFGYIKMKNGATIEVDCSWALNTIHEREDKAMLIGTRAGADLFDQRLVINGERNGKLYEDEYLSEFSKDADEDNANACQLRDWIDSVREGREPLVRMEQALVVCKILDAIYQSAETNAPVYIQ